MARKKINKDIDFKIIAIRPINGISEKLVKVLKVDQIYLFFRDYKINDKGNNITYRKSYPDCLYDYGKLKLNFSAIVGKNGSGKSTIIELLLMTLNNIATSCEVKEDLQYVDGLSVELYIKLRKFHKITVIDSSVRIQDFDETGNLIQSIRPIHSITDLKNLFYTITMNYSHHAYNSLDWKKQGLRDWFPALFHKNDAYQTPIVINPWREEGNIDINKENALVLSRLMSNLLQPNNNIKKKHSFRNITEHLEAYAIKLTLNPEKIQKKQLLARYDDNTKETIAVYYSDLSDINKDKILTKIQSKYNFNYEDIKNNPTEEQTVGLEYIIQKLISISIKYKEYEGNFSQEKLNFEYKRLDKYISDVLKDRTHIGYKLRQTLNFLKHGHISLKDKDTFLLGELSQEIQNVIDIKKSYKDKVIELIPPPIYDFDIFLRSKDGHKSDITFNMMSSGEKQMIYSVSSVLYHLSNLDSVRGTNPKKVQYKVVQILFEEIELYFHPEMQRVYLKYLRDSIISLELEHIKNVSLCFVTHSPFILSDIPKSNIMFLDVRNKKAEQIETNENTFAANIHEMLAGSFFMNNGFCGAYSIDTVNDTISYLNLAEKITDIKNNLKKDPDNKKYKDELEKLSENYKPEDRNNHYLVIKNIGEPILEKKLLEKYNEIFEIESSNDRIKLEIERLEKLLIN